MIVLQTDSYTIRELSETDLSLVLEVYKQCEDFLALGPEPRASMGMVRSDYQHSRDEGGTFCGICTDQGNMIGIVDAVFAGFEGNPEHALISLLMIATPYRCHGIGRGVTAAIEARIMSNPRIKAILAAVQTNNPQAIKFWHDMGYHIAGGPEMRPDATIVYVLRKDIASQ